MFFHPEVVSHLLHDGGQSAQRQAALIPAGHHSAAQFDHNPLGLTQLAAVRKGAALGLALGD